MKTLREILAENKHSGRSQLLADFITRIADHSLGSALKFVNNINAIDESGTYTMSLYRDTLSDKALSINWDDNDKFASISYWNEYVNSPYKPDKEIIFEAEDTSFDALKPIVKAVFERLVSCKEDKKLLENVIFQDGVVLKEYINESDDTVDDDMVAAFADIAAKNRKTIARKQAQKAEEEAKARKDKAKRIQPEHFADPNYVFADIRQAVKTLNSSESAAHGVIVCGPGGFGKSHNVEAGLQEAGLVEGKDWVKYRVRMTTPQIYMSLMENYDKIIIFDDCDEVLLNKTSSDLFKSALETGEKRTISWNKTDTLNTAGLPNSFIINLVKNDKKHRLPSQFVFTGKIIFITNLPIRKIEEALVTRCETIDVTMRSEDLGQAIRNVLPDIKVLAQNRVTGETIDIGTDLDLKNEVLDFLLSPEYQAHMEKYNMSLNMRLFQHAYVYAYRDRSSWKRLMYNTFY